MKNSLLLRKIFLVVVTTLALALLLTGAIYTLTSRVIFASIKANEMMPKARSLGRLIARRGQGDAGSVDLLLEFLEKDSAVLGGSLIVLDADGGMLAASEGVTEEMMDSLDGIVQRALAGDEVSTYTGMPLFSTVHMVCVATPIRWDGAIEGAVLMIVPLYEVLAAVSGLNSALMLALLIIMPLIVVLVYIVIGRMLQPIRRMRDAAIGMASGDFSIEADASQRGEVGQLAASLNHLSSELSHNISELTIERNRLKQSVNGLREGFVSLDSEGRITYFNPAMRELYPGNRSTSDRMALVPDEMLWQAFDRAISDSVPSVYDLAANDRLIRATINPVTGEDGQTVGAVGLFTDITESERLERTRRDYVANVSHELRTPLTAMRGLIEPLRDGMVKSQETRMRYYDILMRETLRLSRLIDDLMELSRLQSGKLSLEVRQVHLCTIIEDLADKYTVAAKEKSQTFRLLTDPAACPDVLTNADRAEQVMVILLDNAMKYTPEGGEISLQVRTEGDHAVVSVSDTGIGISEADLPYVFDRFYKADKSRTGSSGSGLGLSIAREILQSMGERIYVTSQLGRGSTFSFTLTLFSRPDGNDG